MPYRPKKDEDARDIFEKALDYVGPAGGGAALLTAFFSRGGAGKKIWHRGKWHDKNSDELPTWLRPKTAKEKTEEAEGMKKWLNDANADPKLWRRAGLGVAGIGGGYAAVSAAGGKKDKTARK